MVVSPSVVVVVVFVISHNVYSRQTVCFFFFTSRNLNEKSLVLFCKFACSCCFVSFCLFFLFVCLSISFRFVYFFYNSFFEISKIRFFFYNLLTEPECLTYPIGVSSPSIIPDSFFRASTVYSSSFQPAYARLNDYRSRWCAQKNDNTPNDWLQIDFGKIFEVCGVATQGTSYEWIIEFKLSFSCSGDNWESYKDTHGVVMVRFYFINCIKEERVA